MRANLLTQLSEEHRELLTCLEAIQAAAHDTAALEAAVARARLALAAELDAHIALEEDIVFSAVERAVGGDLVAPFRDEHREIRALRDTVLASAAAGSLPPSLCLHLCDLLLAHQQREDMMLFPAARAALDVAE